ncbi:MAG TPA: YjjG family noncanonical pyrimidine nucleotidase [Salinimicrobium sp.]|nr:YjjG family noncanonical pyrimidine nucleotidase [Salinimicrobium sp.]
MKLNNVEHIFFDLDHTLWDFDRNSGLAFERIFKKNKIEVVLSKFLKVYAPINEQYWKLYRENKISSDNLRIRRLKDSFAKLELLLTDVQIQTLSTDYIDHLPRNNFLLEGVEETLEYLHSKYKLHIITNGFRDVQHKKLEGSGISKYFDSITTSEDAGVKKPDKLIFKHALEKSGAIVDCSVMVGDNLEADIIGAQKIGMRTILFNYYSKTFPPHFDQVLKMKEIAIYL